MSNKNLVTFQLIDVKVASQSRLFCAIFNTFAENDRFPRCVQLS